MRKLLALLLVAILPLAPSWAGVAVAVDCGGDASVAAVAQAPVPGDAAAVPDCCGDAGAEPQETQCASDCTECHGLGLIALTGLPPGVVALEAGTGDCTHACRIAAALPGEPLRPPSGARA